jgi:thiol-disulfide isomerase/thioredoxin
MNNWTRKIEILANIAILVVAVLLGVVLVKKYLLTGDRPETAPKIVAGTKMTLPGVDWSKNGQTLMVVLQKGCHFCTESAPFYQRLVKETAERGGVHLVAVLPQEVPEAKKYLEEIKVPIDEVRQASPTALGVAGTPTLILVNEAGVVVDVWEGRLPASEESKVLNRLQGKTVASLQE